jgi:hypothetical protein
MNFSWIKKLTDKTWKKVLIVIICLSMFILSQFLIIYLENEAFFSWWSKSKKSIKKYNNDTENTQINKIPWYFCYSVGSSTKIPYYLMYPFVPLTYTLPVGYTQFLINYATRYQVYDIDGNAGGVLTPYSYGVSLCPKQFQGDVLFDQWCGNGYEWNPGTFFDTKNEFPLTYEPDKDSQFSQFIYKRKKYAKGNDAYVGIYPTSNDRDSWKILISEWLNGIPVLVVHTGGEKWPMSKMVKTSPEYLILNKKFKVPNTDEIRQVKWVLWEEKDQSWFVPVGANDSSKKAYMDVPKENDPFKYWNQACNGTSQRADNFLARLTFDINSVLVSALINNTFTSYGTPLPIYGELASTGWKVLFGENRTNSPGGLYGFLMVINSPGGDTSEAFPSSLLTTQVLHPQQTIPPDPPKKKKCGGGKNGTGALAGITSGIGIAALGLMVPGLGAAELLSAPTAIAAGIAAGGVTVGTFTGIQAAKECEPK